MSEQKQKRVGAIKRASDTTVEFFGYGVHVGDRVHPQWGIPNPCIELDSGGVVFGIECWWGPEDRIKTMIGDRAVLIVPPPDRTTDDGDVKNE